MTSAPLIPGSEPERLQALQALKVLDSIPETEFDDLVRTASLVCGVPISLISLVDHDRQWFKANIGLPDLRETPREAAFCAHAILGDELFEVPDVTLDPRFSENPLVLDAPHIRFYAGMPVVVHGHRIGTLCVIDRQPRTLTDTQREILRGLGRVAARALESRRAALEEKTTSDALVASGSWFRALSESSPLGVFYTDAQGACTYTNPRWQEIYGLSLEESLGQGWSQALHPDDRTKVYDWWQQVAAQGIDGELDFRILRPDGAVPYVRVRTRPVLSGDGSITGYVGTVEDVTQQQRTQALLADSEARLRRLYESTPALLHSIDPQGHVLSVSDTWLARLGYSRDEVIGRRSTDFMTAASRHKAQTVILPELFRIGRVVDVDYQMVARNGEIVDVLLSAVLERDADGRPMRGIKVAQDVTAQRSTERALRKSEAFLDRTGRMAGVGGWEIDLTSNEITWSNETCRIHGVAPGYKPKLDEAINFYAPEARPLIQAAVQRSIEHGEGWDLELPFIQANGKRIWVRAVGSVEFLHGRPQRILGAFQDVSEQIDKRLALQRANERTALATESGNIGIWDFDIQTNTMLWDSRMYGLYGLPESAAENTYELWSRQLHPEDRAAAEQDYRDAVAGTRAFDNDFRIVWPDGTVRHIKGSGRVIRDDTGRALRMVGVNWDITEMRRLAAELEAQHELLQVTLESIGDAVITTDARGNVVWLNPVAERMTGWSMDAARGCPLKQVFHIVNEESRLPSDNPVLACLAQNQIAKVASQTVLIAKDGTEFGIEDSAAPIRNARGEQLGAVLVFHDVTEQRRLSSEMSYRACHDALTGLVNRVEFESRLQRVLDKAHEDCSQHALLYIDLDQFKLVNDACGHAIGDQLLQQVAKLLAECVRSRDTLARLGGDEFAVILEHCTVEQATRLAQQICDRMDDFRFAHDGRRFRIGASIGLVPVDRRWKLTSAILQAADTSCYAAKESGRNRVHAWFDTDRAMQARQVEMQWTTRIEQALDENRFVLFAQRIESLGKALHGVHAEVLLRMVDDDGVLVMPGAFLPSAERFNLISRIDRWVLNAVLDWMQRLAPDALPELLSINLSGQSIGDRAFHRWAVRRLSEAGREISARLCLEITETAAVTNLADASLFIQQVHALGVRVALDDFGAGASSFGYLKSLQVDILKIDGQFIRDLLHDPLDEAAVRCFADIASVLGLSTVAEFVDCRPVMERLREMGVDFAQGYYIHKPEPLSQLLEIPQALAI